MPAEAELGGERRISPPQARACPRPLSTTANLATSTSAWSRHSTNWFIRKGKRSSAGPSFGDSLLWRLRIPRVEGRLSPAQRRPEAGCHKTAQRDLNGAATVAQPFTNYLNQFLFDSTATASASTPQYLVPDHPVPLNQPTPSPRSLSRWDAEVAAKQRRQSTSTQ